MARDYVIGVDLGGTKISAVITDFSGNIINQYTTTTNASQGEQVVLNRIIGVIDKLISDSKKKIEEIKSIGIGSPGPLDAKKGIIITTPNLPFRNFQLVKPIKEKYNLPTYLDNDANVAAIGEFMFGAGKNTENMIYVTVSTGIGGGAILNGKIYRGNTYNALEIGHMTILPNGPKCNCGNYGCAEVLSSGTAIRRQAIEAIESGKQTTLKYYKSVSAYEVFKEAEKGDKVSTEILDRSLGFLGICIANIISAFDPEMIVIGGGVSKGGQIVFDKVKSVVKKRCFDTMARSCKIVPAALDTNAGVVGAAALAMMED